MEKKGADYVAFGAFFSSSTKPNAPIIKQSILKNAKKKLKIPICAIGGITSENIYQLKESDMFAIISDIWKSENIEEKVKLINLQIVK